MANIHIESAQVSWSNNDIEDCFEEEVFIHSNGWIELVATGELYPPHEVEAVYRAEDD